MTYEYREIEPETLGYIRLEKVKCGKPNCHCLTGKKHKAYYLYFRNRLDVQNYQSNRARLKKKYLPRFSVKTLRRKIQLRKNTDNLSRFFDGSDDCLEGVVWQKIKDFPRSKMIEKLHTEIKRALKSEEYQYLTKLSSMLR